MTIPPEVRKVYRQARALNARDSRDLTLSACRIIRLAAALQWAVAEAMKFEHQVTCRAWYYPDEHCAGGICFKTDEELLAEADRELRREETGDGQT